MLMKETTRKMMFGSSSEDCLLKRRDHTQRRFANWFAILFIHFVALLYVFFASFVVCLKQLPEKGRKQNHKKERKYWKRQTRKAKCRYSYCCEKGEKEQKRAKCVFDICFFKVTFKSTKAYFCAWFTWCYLFPRTLGKFPLLTGKSIL